MPLDSDIDNADARLHVEFYECKTEGPWLGKPFVRIIVPGDKTNVIDQPAREDHKRRFQRAWLNFQRQTGEANMVGTPLSQWHLERPDEFNAGQLEELTILKFQSVEQVAQASDGQVMRIGMGGIGVRERAKAYLSSKHAQASGADLAKAQAEIAELKALVANIATMQSAAPLAAAAKPKSKRGGWNKGKKKVSVNVQQRDAATGATSL